MVPCTGPGDVMRLDSFVDFGTVNRLLAYFLFYLFTSCSVFMQEIIGGDHTWI